MANGTDWLPMIANARCAPDVERKVVRNGRVSVRQ
jgi:hypothetical protein